MFSKEEFSLLHTAMMDLEEKMSAMESKDVMAAQSSFQAVYAPMMCEKIYQEQTKQTAILQKIVENLERAIQKE